MPDPALVVHARRLWAARGVVVATDVALAAAPGDVVAVEGPNGSGKSTLLAAAAGLLPAGSASVRPESVGYSPERAGTGDGTVQRVPEAGLPAVLRAVLDAGQVIRQVQPARDGFPAATAGDEPDVTASPGPRRARAVHRVLHGAAHRARLLASSQWFLAPAMLFLLLLAIVYATDAGPRCRPRR